MNTLHIAYRDPAPLTPHPRNSRKHTAAQLDKLARAISIFGFNSPVIINAKGQILVGHARVLCALKLGLRTIPTISIEHLNEAEARAYMIADNQLGDLSYFDEVILAEEFEALASPYETFELTDTGFELAKIDALVEDLHKGNDGADPADALVDPATVEKVAGLGDFWRMGRHSLFVGSGLERESYKALLGAEQAQMIIVDPPYNVRIRGHVSGKGKARHREFVMGSSEMSPSEFVAFLRTLFMRLIEASIDGSIHYVFMDWRGLKPLLEAAEVYTELKNICCWVKSQGGMGSLYRSQHEFVAVLKAGTAAHVNNVALGKHGRNRTNVWTMPGMNSFQKGRAEKLAWHPTVKPVALIAEAILDCSTRGGLILDAMAGSGSAAIAAERTGRTAALIELDPLYADVILRRFCDVTGIEPFNVATGQIVRRRKA